MRSIVFATAVAAPPSMVRMLGQPSSESGASETEAAETDTGTTASSESDSTGSTAPACATYDSSSADSAPIQWPAAACPGAPPPRPGRFRPRSPGLPLTAPTALPPSTKATTTSTTMPARPRSTWPPPPARSSTFKGMPREQLVHQHTSVRECGSGWGNHVVVHHGGLTYTRYAHLSHGQVFVEAATSSAAATYSVMGNTGRSETRHLHFIGYTTDTIDPSSWSERVYDPSQLGTSTRPIQAHVETPRAASLLSGCRASRCFFPILAGSGIAEGCPELFDARPSATERPKYQLFVDLHVVQSWRR